MHFSDKMSAESVCSSIGATQVTFTRHFHANHCPVALTPNCFVVAYRKLPYELGPMPPLAPNCCSLSKIAHKKVNINKVDRRFKCYRDLKKAKPPEDAPTSTTTTTTQPNALHKPPTVEEKNSHTDQMPLKMCREIANLQRNMSRASTSKSPVIFAASLGATRSDSKQMAPTKPHTASLINDAGKLSHRRNLINDFVPTATAAVDTKEIRVKSAISTSRRNSLLDINGQPRKSPREHASTLAILSCLVQERKKREKELNGGISPDKLRPNNDEQTSDGSCGDESNDTDGGVMHTIIKQEVESCDEDVDSVDIMQPTSASTVVADIKSEPIDATTYNEEATVDGNESTKEDAKTEFKNPKMPRSDYVNPMKLYSQIDDLLHTTNHHAGDDEDADDIDVVMDKSYNDVPISTEHSDDLILIGTPKDFIDILLSTAPGPLRYRSLINAKPSALNSFSRSKKRRNNKTGWPTLPKRKIVATKKEDAEGDGEEEEDQEEQPNVDEDSNSCSNLSPTEPEEDECDDNQTTNDDRVDISDQLENGKDEYYIQSRQKLNSMGEDFSKDDEFSNDGNNSLVLYPDTGDKAECSDIFTVSSDSLDTDANESNNKQQQLLDKDYDVISMKSIINVSDEDTSSADVTLAEMLKKQIGVGDKLVRSNRQKNVNKKPNKIANNMKLLQPIIYVKKINESDSESLSKFITGKKNSPIKDESTVGSNSSPNTKCSPRKLRKPRGRWYRER